MSEPQFSIKFTESHHKSYLKKKQLQNMELIDNKHKPWGMEINQFSMLRYILILFIFDLSTRRGGLELKILSLACSLISVFKSSKVTGIFALHK